jgi:hypothetical protein
MERRGIDPRSVEFWNPRVFRDEQQEPARIEGPDVEAGHITPEAADVHSAAQLATNPAAFKGTSRVVADPEGRPRRDHDRHPALRDRWAGRSTSPRARSAACCSATPAGFSSRSRPTRSSPASPAPARRRGQGAGVVAQAARGAEARDRAVHRRPSLVRRPDAPRRAANNRIRQRLPGVQGDRRSTRRRTRPTPSTRCSGRQRPEQLLPQGRLLQPGQARDVPADGRRGREDHGAAGARRPDPDACRRRHDGRGRQGRRHVRAARRAHEQVPRRLHDVHGQAERRKLGRSSCSTASCGTA